LKVSSKPSKTLVTIGTVRADRTMRPYRCDDGNINSLKTYWKFNGHRYEGYDHTARPYRVDRPIPRRLHLVRAGYARTARPYCVSDNLNRQGTGMQPKFS
jgi:hypothetical protein